MWTTIEATAKIPQYTPRLTSQFFPGDPRNYCRNESAVSHKEIPTVFAGMENRLCPSRRVRRVRTKRKEHGYRDIGTRPDDIAKTKSNHSRQTAYHYKLDDIL
jgi:hypothetical protein